jgi:single-stranded DNA-binding protein
MNSCFFIGRFLYDPVLNEVPREDGSKTYVSNFKLAVMRKFKKSGGGTGKQVAFLSFSVWDSAAQLICQEFKKNDYIIVNASARSETCETDTGKKFDKISFRIESFEFLPHNYNDDDKYEATQQNDYKNPK